MARGRSDREATRLTASPRRSPSARPSSLKLLLLAVAILAGCASSGSPKPRASAILRSDPAERTVQLLLVGAADGSDGGFNFDGYGAGEMKVQVPLGWRVDVTCKNASNILSHSCAIVKDRRLSPEAAPIAFPGASTPAPHQGVPPGGVVSFRFVASKAGVYRIACLVSGHEADGMWDWLNVTKRGLPSLDLR